MVVRETLEQRERDALSPLAALSARSKGREKAIEPCPLRTCFQRDRDRIIHCKSFRRMKHKTQVFLSPEGDHYRTRLTHTLEVAQIARTISRALNLNEDLTEAIALGHDLGHTPFGHVGEAVLDTLLKDGFQHNEQSLRVVETLEGGTGLNLTWEVRDGILNHKKDGEPHTLEGGVVSLADRIAYINHDIDDAIRAGVLSLSDMPRELLVTLGESHGGRIHTMIMDVVVQSYGKPVITMSKAVGEATNELRAFLFKNVYVDSIAKREEGKARLLIEQLFRHYVENVYVLSTEFTKNLADGAERVAADYIACMTDRYAIRDYTRLFIPRAWAEI